MEVQEEKAAKLEFGGQLFYSIFIEKQIYIPEAVKKASDKLK